MSKPVISSALLVIGIVLLFVGLSAALGFTAGGAITSLAAIAMLLYAGAVWFGRDAPPPVQPGPADPVIAFDRSLRIVCGSARGASLLAQFPAAMHGELRARCDAALAGDSGRFRCRYGSTEIGFDAVPVRASDGAIVYGLLLSGLATVELSACVPPVLQRSRPESERERRPSNMQL